MLAAGTEPPFQVTFKYEKLCNFCYRCGFLNHVDRFCQMEARDPLPYGSWMRANEGRGQWQRYRGQPRGGGRGVQGRNVDNAEHEGEGDDQGNDDGGPVHNVEVEDNPIVNQEMDMVVPTQLVNDAGGPRASAGEVARGKTLTLPTIGGGEDLSFSFDGQHRKRPIGSSGFGCSSSGVSPPLKKTNSEIGLGLAEPVVQARPPQ